MEYIPEAVAAETEKNTWTMENEVMKAVISFAQGKTDILSLYNKSAEKEYLTGTGERSLFCYEVGEAGQISAGDEIWTLENAEISDITLYGRSWGKKLELTVFCQKPKKLRVKMGFELYHDDGGLRYQCSIRNCEEENLTIERADVIRLDFPREAHTAYYVPNMSWEKTRGSLSGTRNCVMVYDSGDGWSLSPEINWETDGAEGNPPFGGIHVWDEGRDSVCFRSNPEALRLVLFPGEEMEYLAVNLTVFRGDWMDGRMRVERHFRKRYKYWNPVTVICINDWEWYSQGKRNEEYYRRMVIPRALQAGIDQIDVDDLWNTDRDSVVPRKDFTEDLRSLSSYVVSQGLRIGYWFSPSGGDHGGGRDLADWKNIEFKLGQMENTLIREYHSSWCQIDLKQFFRNREITSSSHPQDSVYRKNVNMRKYMNTITSGHPDFLMKITNEVDNNQGRVPLTRNNGLIHVADNGVICAHGEFEERNASPRIAFNSFGYFPMCGCFQYFGTRFERSAGWLYQMLLGREAAVYRALEDWDEEAVALMKIFNDWRKEEHIQELLCQGVLPLYEGDPWVWMNVNRSKTEALLFAIREESSAEHREVCPKLRWLDPDIRYQIRDITLSDQGVFSREELGAYSGGKLMKDGFSVIFGNGSAKAYWIRKDTSKNTEDK